MRTYGRASCTALLLIMSAWNHASGMLLLPIYFNSDFVSCSLALAKACERVCTRSEQVSSREHGGSQMLVS